MLFNSLAFLLFFPTVVFIYFLLPKIKWRNLFLLAASYYFYMNWNAQYALLLLTSTVITYVASIGIEELKGRKKKLCLYSSLVLNLSILFFFKYYNFAAENITSILDFFQPENASTYS